MAVEGVASSGALSSRVSSSSFYFFSPFLFLLCFNRLVVEDLGKRIPRVAVVQGIGAVGARMVLIGGGTLDTRVDLPHGHPWRLSHGGDVATILWPAPRVPKVSSRAPCGNPARLGVCASAAPVIPSRAHARGA
jgi:hypothetical protein